MTLTQFLKREPMLTILKNKKKAELIKAKMAGTSLEAL
jgi:hypothetical protein